MQAEKLVVASMMVLSSSAFAGEPGAYVVGSFGQGRMGIDKSSFDSALANLGVSNIQSSVDERSTAYKVLLGYRINSSFAIEGGYVDLGKFKYSASVDSGGGSAAFEFKAHGAVLSGVLFEPVNEVFSTFAKIGVVGSKLTVTPAASGSLRTTGGPVSKSKASLTYGFGAAYALTRHTDLRLEFERFTNLGDEHSTGKADIGLVSFGVGVTF